jgi:DNA-binding transcriptional ArsR family regulator
MAGARPRPCPREPAVEEEFDDRQGRSLAALASSARLDIVGELLAGLVTRQELQDRLDQATAGQLNHHLRELLSAGLVDQPRRGVY